MGSVDGELLRSRNCDRFSLRSLCASVCWRLTPKRDLLEAASSGEACPSAPHGACLCGFPSSQGLDSLHYLLYWCTDVVYAFSFACTPDYINPDNAILTVLAE